MFKKENALNKSDGKISEISLVPKISLRKKIIFFMANLLVSFFRIFPVKPDKVIFWSKNLKFKGNTKALFLYWCRQQKCEAIWLMDRKKFDSEDSPPDCKNIKIVFLNSLSVFYHLATAKFWIREIEVASPGIQPSRETIVIQLWHAAGAFKKFGLDIKGRSPDLKRYRLKDAKRWDMLLCSSTKVAPIYQKAFALDQEKIFVSGLPRNDFLFNCMQKKKEIRKQFGIPSNVRLVLYAPTFRDKNSGIDLFNDIICHLEASLPDEYMLGVRMHPAVAGKMEFDDDICNLSFYDTEPVLSICDMLITDYSSIIFDFALLERPMLFYAPDLEDYEKDRGFYFDYSSFIPGPLCMTKQSLVEEIVNYDYQKWADIIQAFSMDFHPDFDGKNSRRVFERIMQIRNKQG
jgi:CDP-glycerol glycerophosphotransferase (TagB/SpsB family)